MGKLIQKLEYQVYKRVGKLFVKKPAAPLTWTSKDYKRGKRWAMTQPHPYNGELTLWDYVNRYQDSLWTIHELNLKLNEQ